MIKGGIMKQDVFKGFLERHWKKIILIVILLMSSYKAYANYVSADQRLKETEEAVIMKWFGPEVHYSMVREWNENGVRGWSNWSEETCDQIENAIREDTSEDEQVRSNALTLLNGGSGSDREFDICRMKPKDILEAVGYIEETAVLGELTFQSNNSIKTDSIKIMWEYVNEEMQ